MQIFDSFSTASTPPDSTYVDPDPSTTYDPHPAVTSVQKTLEGLAPEQFGGIYQTKDGVVHVGIVGDMSAPTGAATAAAPSDELQFPAQHTWADLQAISDQLTAEMASNPSGGLMSVSADAETNRVDVGVSDVTSPLAQSIKTEYGDAIAIFADDPIEPLVGVYPDRDKYHQPGYAGLNIYLPKNAPRAAGRACTDGFGYHANPTGISDERGFYTAGHCVYDLLPTQEWNQGGQRFGVYTRNGFRAKSNCDCGTITTDNTSTITFRHSSNIVAIAPGVHPVHITRREAVNSGQKGDVIEVSGARSGLVVGTITVGGQGETHLFGGTIPLRHLYVAELSSPVYPGDSGAPVFQGPDFNGQATAIGILLGRDPKDFKKIYFSQNAWVEFQLRVTTSTS